MSESTYRKKGRALFLAAMMVLSVVAMTTAFAGGAAAQDGPQISGDSTLFFEGQEVTVTGLTGDATYEIREATELDGNTVQSSEFITQMTAESDGTLTIDTDGDLRGSGDYFVDVDESTNLLFEVTTQTFDASFATDSITENDNVELEFDSNRGTYAVNMSADDLDQTDLKNIVEDSSGWELIEDDSTTETDNGVHDDGNVTIVRSGSSSAGGAADLSFNSEYVDTGNYTFEFNVVDTAAQDTANITVNSQDVERAFVDAPYVEERGEEFNTTIELEDTSEADVILGDFDDVGYEVGFNVEDTSGDLDQVNVTFNSYKAGTSADLSDAIYAQNDDVEVTFAYANISEDSTIFVNGDADYSEFVSNLDGDLDTQNLAESGTTIPNAGEGEANEDLLFDERMAAGQYALNLGDTFTADNNGYPELDNGNDKSFIRLTENSAPGDVATHTAPSDADMGSLEDFEDATVTATDAVAKDDHLLLTVEDAGLTGLVSSIGSDQSAAEAFANEGIYFEIEQTDVPANQGDRVWNNSLLVDSENDGDYQLDFDVVNGDDYDGEQLILSVPYDTLEEELGDANTRNLQEDDSFDWELKFSDDGDYFNDEAAVNGSLDLTEREVSLGNHEEVPNADDVEIGGSTTVAPGTEVTLIASGPTFVQTQSPEVTENRTFADSFNFGDYEAGTAFTLEAEETNGNANDDLDAELVDAEEAIFNLNADAPAEATVGDDATLDVTVSNDGASADEVEIGVDVAGEAVFSENVSIEPGEEWSESFELPTDEAGDVNWGVTAGDDSDSGTLTVSEASENGEPENGEPENGEPENGEPENGEPENGDEDSTPGFGAAVAAIALLASALLAVRRQN